MTMPDLANLPNRDPSRPNTEQGLYRKFDVRRTDGSDKPGGEHYGCDYFVLDVTHDPLAKPALAAYAAAAEPTYPQLAADMRDRYGLTPSAPVGVEAVRAARGEILSEAYKHVGTPRRVLLDAVDRIDVALAKQQAAVDEETAWREGWAIAYSGVNKLYGDDGELQDASDHPFIDWRRDSATEIRRKIHDRAAHGARGRWPAGGES